MPAIRPLISTVSIAGCETCRHQHDAGSFLLCMHSASAYKADEKDDFHTCRHMRSEYGACGPDGRLKEDKS